MHVQSALLQPSCMSMPTYTFYLHTPKNDVPSFRVVECADDREAQRLAMEELGFSRDAQSVEVRRGEDAVCVLRR